MLLDDELQKIPNHINVFPYPSKHVYCIIFIQFKSASSRGIRRFERILKKYIQYDKIINIDVES